MHDHMPVCVFFEMANLGKNNELIPGSITWKLNVCLMVFKSALYSFRTSRGASE